MPHQGGAIPEDRTWLNGRCIAPLDIVEMQLEAPTFDTRFQRENCQVRNWNWRLVGRAAAADVLRYCTGTGHVLHSTSKVVEPAQMELLPPEQWASLELVHARESFSSATRTRNIAGRPSSRWGNLGRILHRRDRP